MARQTERRLPFGRWKCMEVKFEVKISCSHLFDYLVHFTYLSLQGLIGVLAGAFFMVQYFMSFKLMYLAVGLIILGYLPVSLFLKAKQQSLNPVFKEPLHYRMTEEGVYVSQGEEEQMQKWEDMYKAGSTIGSVLLYTAKRSASIFPKGQLKKQDVYEKVVEMISTHMPPKKVNIR